MLQQEVLQVELLAGVYAFPSYRNQHIGQCLVLEFLRPTNLPTKLYNLAKDKSIFSKGSKNLKKNILLIFFYWSV